MSTEIKEQNSDYDKYRAQCLIEAAKLSVLGILIKSETGATISELEVTGLNEVLGMASEIVSGIS